MNSDPTGLLSDVCDPRNLSSRVQGTQRSRTAPGARVWRLFPPPGARERALNYLLAFATVVLLVDALVGERGLVATTRARRLSG